MKPHLLLLPGLLCDHASWGAVPTALADCAQIQVADYGLADSLTRMAEGVLRNAPERFSMAGHSMGGRVAFEILRLAPQRVDKVAILDSGHLPLAAGEAGEAEISKRMDLLALSRNQGMRAMAAVWSANMVEPSRLQDQVLMESILQMVERKNPEIFAAQLNALIHRPDASAQLQALTHPLLLICGRHDLHAPVSQHEAMQLLAPASSLSVIEDCGHMAQMEAPQAMVDLLRQFFLAQ